MRTLVVVSALFAALACNTGGSLGGAGTGKDGAAGADAQGGGEVAAGDVDGDGPWDPPSWWLDANSDAPPKDVPLGSDPCVPRATPGDRLVGSPCTADGQCATGICYDEAWKDIPSNGGFRFCTAACTGCATACNKREAITDRPPTCFPLPSSEVEKQALFYPSLCLPTCFSDAECATASGGALTTCRRPKDFQGTFIGVAKSCFP